MAWKYSDYLTKDVPAERLTQLRLHVKEVSDRLSSFQTSPALQGTRYAVESYLRERRAELRRLETALGVGEAAVTRNHYRIVGRR